MPLTEAARKKIKELKNIADQLPAIVIVHNVHEDLNIEYMSKLGLTNLGVSLEEVKAMGSAYHTRFFNPLDLEFYKPKVQEMISLNNMDHIISLFQQVRKDENTPWSWYMNSMRIFMRDSEGLPYLSITHATPIDQDYHLIPKVAELLDNRALYRENIDRYRALSRREREVLMLLADAKTNKEISEKLFISINTVETHKKKLKEKLAVENSTQLVRLARAFEG